MSKGEHYSWEEVYRACGCSPRYVEEDDRITPIPRVGRVDALPIHPFPAGKA